MTLQAHWPLDEDSGTTATDYAGSYDLSWNNVTARRDGPLGTSAYDLDSGNSDQATFSPSWSFSEFTVTGWAYHEDETSDEVIWDMGGNFISLGANYSSNSGSSNKWFAQSWDGSNHVFIEGTDTSNEWRYITLVADGSEYKLYENATLTASGGYYREITSGHDHGIGGNAGSGRQWNGGLSNVRIYDHALTPQEIQYLYWVAKENHYVSLKKVL